MEKFGVMGMLSKTHEPIERMVFWFILLFCEQFLSTLGNFEGKRILFLMCCFIMQFFNFRRRTLIVFFC